MAVGFITAIEITGLTGGAWSSAPAPAEVAGDASGVFGVAYHTVTPVTATRGFGFRDPRDTANTRIFDERGDSKPFFWCSGLDDSHEFGYYVENANDCHIWVTGFFDTDVTMLSTTLEATYDKDNTWQRDVGLGGFMPASTRAIVWEFTSDNAGGRVGIQSADETTDIAFDMGMHRSYHIVPVTAARTVDILHESGGGAASGHVIGYMEFGGVAITPQDVTPSTNAIWEQKGTTTGAGAAFVAVVDDDNSAASGDWGVRKNQSKEHSWFVGNSYDGATMLVELDNEIFEAYLEDISIKSIYLLFTVTSTANSTILIQVPTGPQR